MLNHCSLIMFNSTSKELMLKECNLILAKNNICQTINNVQFHLRRTCAKALHFNSDQFHMETSLMLNDCNLMPASFTWKELRRHHFSFILISLGWKELMQKHWNLIPVRFTWKEMTVNHWHCNLIPVMFTWKEMTVKLLQYL